MPSAATAGKRTGFVSFRFSREERERLEALACASEVSRSEWIREVLVREIRRLERERRAKEGEGYFTCSCPSVRSGAFCVLCGYRKSWVVYRQWQARERMRRLRAERRGV